jgi:hypothetical protein
LDRKSGIPSTAADRFRDGFPGAFFIPHPLDFMGDGFVGARDPSRLPRLLASASRADQAVDVEGINSRPARGLAVRANIWAAVLGILIIAILILMVFKPA